MTATLEKMMIDAENEGRAEGRIEGRTEGRIEGRIDAMIELASNGLLTIAQAAAQIGESEQDFSRRLHQ